MPQVISRPGPFAIPYTYDLGATDVLRPGSIFASFDGSAASGAFLPCVSYYSQDGTRIMRAFPGSSVAAGASADVTWFPNVGVSGGQSIDTTDGATDVNPTSELLIGAGLQLTSPSPRVAELRTQIPPNPGGTVLLYDFTITGAAQRSIDTNVDGPDAGLFSTAFNYLEVFLTGRTDEAPAAPFVVPSDVAFNFNNDVAANYTRAFIASSVGGSPGQGQAVSGTGIAGVLASKNAAAGYSGLMRMFIPNYAGGTFNKIAEFTAWATDNTAATSHYQIGLESAIWNSTAPITRIAATPETAGVKLDIGTRLSVWAR